MSFIINHVSHIYGEKTTLELKALDDISLTIEDGEFIGLIGHTGSGKSTFIQHLNGLLKATSGQILYNGEDIYDKDYDRVKLRYHVGLVFQYPEHQLFEESVFKDVCFGPKNMGLSEKEAELKAYEALRMVKMPDELFYVSPFDLSGGQKRRAAIAGVLAMQPDVLILDEPTAGLDPCGRDEILNLISELHEVGKTVILVSHSMDDVANYVDRIIVMNRGRVAMDGRPGDIFARFRELQSMGLAAPEVTYIMHKLNVFELPVNTRATTIKEAADSVMGLFQNKPGDIR